MYQSSVPVFTHFLKALAGILKKAKAHCAERSIGEDVIVNARLFPDMLPFSRQVTMATDAARRAGARLAGLPEKSVPDEEKTIDELLTRIESTIFFLSVMKVEQFAGAEERPIVFKMGGHEMSFSGASYLDMWAKPNFFFHITTAYAILRSNGIDVGKRDFLGMV